jgi:PKD repeat protein
MKIKMKTNLLRYLILAIMTSLITWNTSIAKEDINFVTYGPEASIKEGDDDFIQIFYIRISDKAEPNLVLELFDPDCHGEFDTQFGEFNSHYSFRLYGGKGIYSNPKAQTTHPDQYTINEGKLLTELKTSNISQGDSEWIKFADFDINEGEKINDHFYFKFVVEGVAGNDANVFNLRVSNAPDEQVKIFNYCPTIRLDVRSKPIQLRFIAPVDEPVTFHNFDADNKPLYVITPFRSEMMLNASGEGNWKSNGVKFKSFEKENICALQFGPGSSVVNDATFYITSDENIVPFYLPVKKKMSNNRPVVNYSVDYSSDCYELILNATATDTDNDQFNFKWFFDDGQIVEARKTNKVFEHAGTYKAILVAYDNSNAIENGTYKNINLVVNESPAAIAMDDFISFPNQNINFNASKSFDDDGRITKYEWDFGDGNKGDGQISKHSYPLPGRYQAVLKVTDDSPSKCNVDYDTVNVWINDQPIANAGKDISVSINEKFTLDGSKSSDKDGSIESFSWNMKDGTILSGEKINHAFSRAGKFDVQLTVKDDTKVSNNKSTDNVIVTVNKPPTASAGKDLIVAVNQSVTFDGSASKDLDGEIINYKWDFGDGTLVEEKTVKHSFSKPGKYISRLTVTDNSGTSSNYDTDERKIVVNSRPIANAGDDVYQTKNEVVFNANRSKDNDGEIINYQWDFGDGTTGSKSSYVHKYEAPGTYIVTLKITDNTNVSNNNDIDTVNVVINAKPIADAGPDIIAAPNEKISLNGINSIDPDGTIKKYIWSFNKQELSKEASLEYSFEKPGQYEIQLMVHDDSGHPEAFDSDKATVTVNAQPVIVVDEYWNVAPNQLFTIDASETFDIDDEDIKFKWVLNGKNIGTSNYYTTEFKDPGINKILLEVSDSKGALNSSVQKEIIVAVNHKPVPITKSEIKSCSRIISFNATESFDTDNDDLKYNWFIGSGEILTGANVRYNFKKSGVFPVVLSVDDGKGLSNSVQPVDIKVIINTPPIANAGPDLIVCSGDVVNLDASESLDEDADLLKYEWDFGDNTNDEGLSVTKVYNKAGVYVVKLKVTDNSGLDCNEDIDTKIITVVESPVAFAGDDIIACTNAEVTFDASGSTDSDGIVNSFMWDFGDGENGGGEKTTHIYKEPGTYKVQLSITGELVGECDNTDTDELIVSVTDAPLAAFQSVDSVALGSSISFDASTSFGNNGEIISYDWNFGDGNRSKDKLVSHTYSEAGIYTTELTIETQSSSECKTSSVKKSIYVNAQPTAKTIEKLEAVLGESIVFDASDSFDEDGEITKYIWNFGNGKTKEGIKVRHTFIKEGTEEITLTVIDNTGLINNSDTKKIIVDVISGM